MSKLLPNKSPCLSDKEFPSLSYVFQSVDGSEIEFTLESELYITIENKPEIKWESWF